MLGRKTVNLKGTRTNDMWKSNANTKRETCDVIVVPSGNQCHHTSFLKVSPMAVVGHEFPNFPREFTSVKNAWMDELMMLDWGKMCLDNTLQVHQLVSCLSFFLTCTNVT